MTYGEALGDLRAGVLCSVNGLFICLLQTLGTEIL